MSTILEYPDENSKTGKWLVPKMLPADSEALSQALQLAKNGRQNTSKLVPVLLQDPVLVIEVLKEANNSSFAGGATTLTTLRPAIVRLGAARVHDLLTQIARREAISEHKSLLLFQRYRSRCKRIGGVARIIAEVLARHVQEECEVIGLLSSIGDMLAVFHFGETYVELAEDSPRATVNYRLIKHHHFDVQKRGLAYLRRSGIPEFTTSIIDEEVPLPQPEQKTIRLIHRAAIEFVDAFDNDKWDKLAPEKELPPSSILRLLKLNERQHMAIYSEADGYLSQMSAIDRGRERLFEEQTETEEDNTDWDTEDDWSWFDDDIEELESTNESLNGTLSASDEPQLTELDSDLDELLGMGSSESEVEFEEVSREQESVAETSFLSSYETVLGDSLNDLINGPFSTAALISFSQDKKEATIVVQRGDTQSETKISITDKDSPLLRALSKTQTFSSRQDSKSPFGSSSYAISPLETENTAPLALYADCGSHSAITLHGRRLFRDTVQRLNQQIQTLPKADEGEKSTG
ncbi:MAG: HDOD domain-containing protein [Bdellovibrionota bacterium]